MASSACRARPLEACDYSFRMESCGMESLDLEKSRVAREKLFGLGQGRRIGGGFAPGLGAGLPWRRCKMQSKAKDGRTLQDGRTFQGAWFEPFGQHVFGDA